MAVLIDEDMFGPFVYKYRLQVTRDQDAARIKAGKDYFAEKRKEWIIAGKGKFGLIQFGAVELPWHAEFLPEQLTLTEGEALPDWVHAFPGGSYQFSPASLVTSNVRDIIESHRSENDAWKFFPVKILRKDGSEYGTYYAWWIDRVCDAVDEASEGVKLVSKPKDGNHLWTTQGEPTPDRLSLHKSQIEGLNAWTDFRISASKCIFVSDKLFSTLGSGDLQGFAAKSIWSEK
jgi:hypothetical protein